MSDRSRFSPVSILRGAAVVFGVMGLGLSTWLIDKMIRYPQIRASQFGRTAPLDQTAPLWTPMLFCVVLGTGLSIYLFLRAARRAEHGEDLFAQRHRRRGADEADGEDKADERYL